MKKWEQLPDFLRTDEVYPYYAALQSHRGGLVCKRLFDIGVSALLLILISPLLALIALAIVLDSRGGAFFRQTRVTAYGREFRILKFRTMVANAEKLGTQVTVDHDPRITRMGRLLRGLRLDELPQLWNILVGDMSFVGTRPEAVKYVQCYTPEMNATLLLRAGVTSEASIRFKDEAALLSKSEDADRTYVEQVLPIKMRYNLDALVHFSVWQDVKTMVRTVLAVLGKDYEKIENRETVKQ